MSQVTADDSLAHALLAHPLQLTLYKQGVPPNSRRHPRGASTGNAAAVTEAVGSADVDLSGLLIGRCVLLYTWCCLHQAVDVMLYT